MLGGRSCPALYLLKLLRFRGESILLRTNRRMMMRNQPHATAINEQPSKACGVRCLRWASEERIESGDNHGPQIACHDHPHVVKTNRVPSGRLYRRQIRTDRVSALGDDQTSGAEQHSVWRIELDQPLTISRIICRCPAGDYRLGLIRGAACERCR
jgi:hypothetical protein